MRHYRATNTQTAQVVEYDAEIPQDAHRLAPWVLEDVVVAEPIPGDPPVDPVYPPEAWRITKLAFRDRFAQAEQVAIEIAALDVPSASMQQRTMSAALRAQQDNVLAATYIDLMRADTRAGVQALEDAGLIATGRAAQILDTLPIAEELYRG